MGKLAELYVIISANAEKFTRTMDDVQKQVGTIGSKFSGLWKQVAAGVGVTWAIGKGFQQLTSFISSSVKEAAYAERIDKALAAAIETTGRNIEAYLPYFQQRASALQKQTIYTDEAIKETQALLVQLTKLDREGIDRATKGAMGLASVFGIDLTSAATIVAKALSGNYAALSRYGIKVKETATEGEKQAEILTKLEVMYGRATRETDSYSGATARLKNVFSELKEKLGEAITKNELVRDAIKRTAEIIEDQIPKVEKAVQGWNLYWSAFKEGVDVVSKLGEKEKELIPAFGTEEWAKHLKATERLTRQDWALIDATVELHKSLSTLKFVQEGWGETTRKNTKEMAKAISAAYEFQKTLIPKMEVPYEIEDFWTKYKDTLGEVAEENEHLFDAWEADTGDYEGFMLRMSQATGVWTQALQDNIEKTIPAIEKMNEEFQKQQAFFMDMVMATERGVKSIILELKKWAIMETVLWIFKKVPFPFSVPVAMAAAAAISALVKGLTGYEKGGIAWHPQVAKIAEKGPELIWPLYKPMPSPIIEKISSISTTVNKPSIIEREVVRTTPIQPIIQIYARTLDRDTVDKAAELIYDAIGRQKRRRG
jgi:hypothetical protein